MADRQDLHDVVEELPASELGAALRYLRFLWCPAHPHHRQRVLTSRRHHRHQV